jgi:hypothetical protein
MLTLVALRDISKIALSGSLELNKNNKINSTYTK